MNLSNNMNEITNGEIDRLGAAIADKNGDISDSELELLQTFRVSFSKPLSQTFNEIRDLTYKIRKDSITACRLKRIGTILNKIPRQPKMKLSRMGDIAGIRCIFNNEKELYKAVTLIKDNWLIRFVLCHRFRSHCASDFGSNRAIILGSFCAN